jgi:hypothetical protein
MVIWRLCSSPTSTMPGNWIFLLIFCLYASRGSAADPRTHCQVPLSFTYLFFMNHAFFYFADPRTPRQPSRGAGARSEGTPRWVGCRAGMPMLIGLFCSLIGLILGLFDADTCRAVHSQVWLVVCQGYAAGVLYRMCSLCVLYRMCSL